ncbi:hypothetical protein GCM10023235_46990 [Kitasatospora terrestris]|uniref:Uncharacterized protein n=2 Tax=Kitasatospora terrestris TaxID=258051 RepID=A0ABP9DXU8_9ACTN
MHATLSTPQLSPASAVLSGTARAVALYASDMPDRSRFSATGEVQTEAWVSQGVERLGLEQVQADGEFLRSFHLSLMRFEDTPADHRAFRQRFPSKRRISSAEDMAAMLTWTQANRADAQRVKVVPFPYTVQSTEELIAEGWMAA